MGKLIYTAIASLDGYVADSQDRFDWAVPDDEVHAFINGLERPVRTYLYGRRMYETMAPWDEARRTTDGPQVVREFASIWQRAEKVVYSTTLQAVTTAKTRVEPVFEPGAVAELKETSPSDISIGGANLASHAARAGLIDEYQLFLVPVIVGNGRSWLADVTRVNLDLLDERSFRNGTVFLHYGLRA